MQKKRGSFKNYRHRKSLFASQTDTVSSDFDSPSPNLPHKCRFGLNLDLELASPDLRCLLLPCNPNTQIREPRIDAIIE